MRSGGSNGRGSHRGGGGRGRRPRSRARRVLLIGLAVILVLLIAGVGYAYYWTHDLHRVQVNGLRSNFLSGAEVGTENILMLGSTSRCALAVQNPAYGLCSQGVTGVNSDVIMILHVDQAHRRLALLSIPRDLFIPNARSTGANKIDAGLYQGVSQLVTSIEEDFGIPIQHAVELNFDQFANVVNALGGINMSFPESVFDAESGLNVQAAACVHLNGTQALQVVRARHLQYKGTSSAYYAEAWPYENQSDLARIRRDHEFLRVLASAVAKRGLGNPIADISLINSLKSDLSFDQSWSVNSMAALVLDFHHVNMNAVPQLTLPVAQVNDPNGGTYGDLMYRGYSYGQVEFPVASADRAVIDKVLGIAPNVDALSGQKLPAPSAVTVSVMNGSGVANQAATTQAQLGALGFHTVGVGDVTPSGDVDETVVYYGSHAASAEAAAEEVASSMSGAVIIAYDPSRVTNGAEVTVVTGTDFSVNATAGAAGTTTTTAPSQTSSSAISAPSPSNQPLQPWDPRACAPGATPTAPLPNPTY